MNDERETLIDVYQRVWEAWQHQDHDGYERFRDMLADAILAEGFALRQISREDIAAALGLPMTNEPAPAPTERTDS